MEVNNNLESSFASSDVKELIKASFELMKTAEKNKNLYKDPKNVTYIKNLIDIYYRQVNPSYEKLAEMFTKFRKTYIDTESIVEKNNTKEEKEGLGLAYDYIQGYDVDSRFNLLVSSFKIHSLLFKPLDNRNAQDYDEERSELFNRLKALKASSVKDRKEIFEVEKLIKKMPSSPRFGGKLRTDEVKLNDVDFKVPYPEDASKFINSFNSTEKIDEFNYMLRCESIFKYIEYCVRIFVDMIKYQPFSDGNKRTSRSLLNLMFRLRNIPPVYIKNNERSAWKDALINCLENNDYTDMINFYYFKICDSIYEFDVKNYIEKDGSIDYSNDIGTIRTEKINTKEVRN